MEFMDILDLILAIVTGVAACVPLVIQLVKYIKEAARSKNWAPLMQLVLKLMTEAEANYSTGAERKEYVLDSINAIKNTLNYDVDMKVVEEMIDSIIDATKKINIKK